MIKRTLFFCFFFLWVSTFFLIWVRFTEGGCTLCGRFNCALLVNLVWNSSSGIWRTRGKRNGPRSMQTEEETEPVKSSWSCPTTPGLVACSGVSSVCQMLCHWRNSLSLSWQWKNANRPSARCAQCSHLPSPMPRFVSDLRFYRSSLCCYHCYEFIRTSFLLCLRNSFLEVIRHLWTLQSFHLLSHRAPWASRAVLIWIRAERAEVSCSLQVGQS